MAGNQVLLELTRQVRHDTLQVLAATEPPQLTFVPPGTANHILWHAGHALWVQDLMCVAPLAGASELPQAWLPLFRSGSEPALTEQWPAAAEVQSQLEAQRTRMLELLAEVSDKDLQRPAAGLSRERNLMGWILHGLHDEAKHCGEMYLLWKLSKPS